MRTIQSTVPPGGTETWPPFRVLFVDDHHDYADSAVLLLRAMGFEATACYDGESALTLNNSIRPAICFLDLDMPGMDGHEVARRLLSAEDWRPLVLVAMTDERNDARISASEFHLHLVKPVNSGNILQVVDALFRGSALSSSPPINAVGDS